LNDSAGASIAVGTTAKVAVKLNHQQSHSFNQGFFQCCHYFLTFHNTLTAPILLHIFRTNAVNLINCLEIPNNKPNSVHVTKFHQITSNFMSNLWNQHGISKVILNTFHDDISNIQLTNTITTHILPDCKHCNCILLRAVYATIRNDVLSITLDLLPVCLIIKQFIPY